MQFVVPAPVNDVVPQVRAATVGEICDPDPFSWIEVVFEVEPCVAIIVTVCEDVTADTVAEKLTLVAPEGTITDAGTPTAPLLLARLTATPALGAAPLIATVQRSLPAPIIEEFAQLTPVSDGPDCEEPFPCSLMELVVFVVPVLIAVTLSCPVRSVVVPGSKRT